MYSGIETNQMLCRIGQNKKRAIGRIVVVKMAGLIYSIMNAMFI